MVAHEPPLTPNYNLTQITAQLNSMSKATRPSERRRVAGDSTQGGTNYVLDTVTEGISQLEITGKPERDQLLPFDTKDKRLRLTTTSSTGIVRLVLYLDNRPDRILKEWKLTAWRGKAHKKTLSLLILGPNLPPRVAKSGWSHWLDQDEPGNIYSPIKGSTYTEKAWRLCGLLGCTLEATNIDAGGKPGFFEASHAEMHLITWFVETYFPLLLEDNSATWRVERPLYLESVLIISNREPYPSCQKLAARVRELTGVAITIEYRVPNIRQR